MKLWEVRFIAIQGAYFAAFTVEEVVTAVREQYPDQEVSSIRACAPIQVILNESVTQSIPDQLEAIQ